MKKLSAFVFVLLLAISFSACGSTQQQAEHIPAQQESDSISAQADEKDTNIEETDLINTENNLENGEQGDMEDTDILIACFSRADENYGVGVIEKGNTEIIAEMIADETGGELFHIERAEPYPADYDECTDEA